MFRVFSFHQGNIPEEVLASQRAVFAHHGIPLEQYYSPLGHGEGIDECLEKHQWDSVALFDIDCICLDADYLIDALYGAMDQYIVIGGAHNANHLPGTNDYVSPACCVLSRNTWKTAGVKFAKGVYDVGQRLSYTVLAGGGRLDITYPVSVDEERWYLAGGGKLGYGTDYGWCYHQFNGSIPTHHDSFIARCRREVGSVQRAFL